MTTEFNALLKNNSWVLVPLPLRQRVVDNKSVFKIKHRADRSIEGYKGRLILKGFHQQVCVKLDETFTPVIKPIRFTPSLDLLFPMAGPYISLM